MKKQIYTHISILRVLFLLLVMVGESINALGQEEIVEHEYYYTVKEVYNDNVFRTTKGDVDNVWFTSFDTKPSGISYSVQASGDPQATVDIESGVLCFHQNSSGGDRGMYVSFTDSKFNVAKTNWILEFDWGASSSNANPSNVSFATNIGTVFTIKWEVRSDVATITAAEDEEGASPYTLPIDGYNKPTMDVPSHFIIEGDKNNGIYLTVICNGTTYVDNVLVSSSFGYPATFNGTLGGRASHMFLDNIYFNTDNSITSFKVPYRRYNLLDGKLYKKEAKNSEYNETINLPMGNSREVNLEYSETTIQNVVYLSEAEDIPGLTHCTGNTGIRSSNSSSAYAADKDIEFTRLNAGVYKLTAAIYDATSTPREWIFYADNEEIARLKPSESRPYKEETTEAFVIEKDDTPICLGQGGSKDKGIDFIYIQKIAEAFPVMKWTNDGSTVVKSVTVDISNLDENNHTSDLPTKLLNAEGKTNIVYASENEEIAKMEYNLPRIRSVGTTVITATNTKEHIQDEVELDVARYTLNVIGATNVKGEFDKETNTYTFNRVGQTFNTNTIQIEGITMTYGNKGSTAVIVRNEEVGPILKVIDGNGYSHPNLAYGRVTDVIPADGINGGTYYVFKPSISGKLTVTGQLSNATIYQYDNDTATKITDGNNGTKMTVSLTEGNTYYLYNGRIDGKDNATPLLHSFSYEPIYSVKLDYKNKIKVDRTPQIDGFAFNNKIELTPSLKVVYNNTEISDYTVNYSIDNNTYATIDQARGVLTTKPNTENGKVEVTAKISVSGKTLTQTFSLMVINGNWDFRKYSDTYHTQLKTTGKNYGLYDKDTDVWSESSSNSHVKSRDTKEFEYMLRGDDEENEPIDIAYALQSRYSVRWMRYTPDPGYFYLFGRKEAKHYHGGVIKVPVQKGMIIEINGYSNAEYSEMLINNTGSRLNTNIKQNSAVSKFDNTSITNFFVSAQPESYRFIVTNPSEDGFLYIINPSSSLPFIINWIKLSNELLFKYGTETYTDQSTFKNPILNANESDKFEYEIISDDNGLCKDIADDGMVNLNAGRYGTFVVKVTGTEGNLKGITSNDTVHVIKMEVENASPRIASDDLEWSPEELKDLITKISYGPEGAELDVKNKVEFSEIARDKTIRRVTFTGDIGSQRLAVEGVGKDTIQARLGCVEKPIILTVEGLALMDRSPVVHNSSVSASVSVSFFIDTEIDNVSRLGMNAVSDTDTEENAEEDVNGTIVFDTEWMFKNILGDLRNYRNEGQADELQLKYDEKNRILTLFRRDGSPFGHGGAMPIKGTYKYDADNDGAIDEDEIFSLNGVLTIAYSSKSWNFDENMLLYNQGVKDGDFKGIHNFYTNTEVTIQESDQLDKDIEMRLGEWTKKATFDEPVDQPTIQIENPQWRFVRKMGNTHPESDIIYYYNHTVDGDNAKILPKTAGLLINSDKNERQFGVQMLSTRTLPAGSKDSVAIPNVVDIDANFDGKVYKKGYDIQNVMFRIGGELIVPNVKPGQWIEMRWYRHVEDLGEQMTLTNLCDVEGNKIDETYLIGNTDKGTYMFQVNPESAEEWVDAKFRFSSDTYISIQQVILHEPGWEYKSSMTDVLSATDNNGEFRYQYTTGKGNCKITLNGRSAQNAPNAPRDWLIRKYGPLVGYDIAGNKATRDGKTVGDNYYADEKPSIIVTGGWGKVYVTLNSYTSDYKYLANRKTWVITFGKAPEQDYPYTWDFTKYFADTKSWISDDDVLIEYNDTLKDCDSYGTDNPTGSHELRIQTNTWNNGENEEVVVTTDYDTEHYESFFVDGAQLVSYGLQGDKNDDTEGKTDDNSKGNGVLPETAGLGFKVKNLGDKNNDNVGILKLDMQSADKKKGYEAQNGETWRNGKLAIRGGGSIIVPRPKVNDKESTKKAEDFYIYVKSSKEPTKACNTDAKSYEKIAEGLYKYRFAAAVDNDIESGNVVLDFDGDADVYAIAVTNKFKEMALLSGTGWATESRDTVIDHTLTGYLTTYPTKVYAVVETDDNPLYSDSKNQTVVALKDQRYVVPVNYGLVMKQTENVPMPAQDETTGKATYRVPLFVPAVTTVEDNIGEGEFNLMRANVNETIFDTEKEKKDVSPEDDWKNAVGNDYTRFILASRYMTWKRQDGELTTTEFESGDVAAFYRLHVYSEEEAKKSGKATTELNTLKANTAYLLLRSSKINEALWNSSNGTRQYIGIQGVSDMYDDANDPGTGAAPAEAQGIYNLSGQKLNPGGELAPGVYIINGKKIIIRRNNGK